MRRGAIRRRSHLGPWKRLKFAPGVAHHELTNLIFSPARIVLRPGPNAQRGKAQDGRTVPNNRRFAFEFDGTMAKMPCGRDRLQGATRRGSRCQRLLPLPILALLGMARQHVVTASQIPHCPLHRGVLHLVCKGASFVGLLAELPRADFVLHGDGPVRISPQRRGSRTVPMRA